MSQLLNLPCLALDRIVYFLFDPTTRKDKGRLAPLPRARKSMCFLALSSQALRCAVFRGFTAHCSNRGLFTECDERLVWGCIRVWCRGTISLSKAKKIYQLTESDLTVLECRKRNNGWNRMTFFLELEVFLLSTLKRTTRLVKSRKRKL
jgi:hypothetical protein